ncbi:MAG: polysaccharide deacetylase family protein [Deltaproteobacteria bacterium]|nr:polysaccharide deacetylase family protein [Deltaproteobacteria bacterium]
MKPLLLTFDVEEFDLPAEWGRPLPPEAALDVTAAGLDALLPVLARHAVVATFFATGCFAAQRPEWLRRLTEAGHEVGVHGLEHGDDYGALDAATAVARLQRARALVQLASGQPAHGVRTPHLRPCPLARVRAAGFRYDASPHPTWVPRRYNGLRWPRRPWREDGVWRLPISVVPVLRWPVSFIWFRAMGPSLAPLATRAAGHGAPYLHLYFHPWEALPIGRFGAPSWLAVRTGARFVAALDAWLAWSAGRHAAATAAAFCTGLSDA